MPTFNMPKFKEYSLAEIAANSQILSFTTKASDGNHETYGDSVQIPEGSFGILTLASQGHPSQLNGNVGLFVCNESMSYGASPLLQDGSLDPSKIGPLISFDASNVQNIGQLSSFNPGYILVPPLGFLRASSFLGPGTFPNNGDFATIRYELAIMKLCEVC